MTIQLDGGIVPLTVGLRLELARRAAGYTQQQLADVMEVGVSTVSRLEKGEARLKRPILLAWAMATGANRTWLETGMAPTDDGGGQNEQDPHSARNEGLTVRHQGLEPRTRCLSVTPAQAA